MPKIYWTSLIFLHKNVTFRFLNIFRRSVCFFFDDFLALKFLALIRPLVIHGSSRILFLDYFRLREKKLLFNVKNVARKDSYASFGFLTQFVLFKGEVRSIFIF